MILPTSTWYQFFGGHRVDTVQISARIDRRLKEALDDYCRRQGVVMNHFIQEAIIDRLEELQDVEDLRAIRHEPTRPLRDVLAELQLDDALLD